MKIKELFKMVEKSNELKILLNEKELYIEVVFDRFSYKKATTYNEYKKLVKNEVFNKFIDDYLNTDLIQDEKYNNSFYGCNDLEFNILENIYK